MSKSNELEPRTFNHRKCGRISITFNLEREIKTRLVADGTEWEGLEDIVAEKMWADYRAKKEAEWLNSFDRHTLKRAKGRVISTPLAEEKKAKRIRTFQTVASGHPPDIEIRMEDLLTMIKIADHRKKKSPVLCRTEIKIKQQLLGQVSLKKIPGALGDYVFDSFNHGQKRFDVAMSESFRLKIKVPIEFTWKNKKFIMLYERALDIGVIQSRAGHLRDITEFEGEVKEIYTFKDFIAGRKVDIKDTPEYAGLDQKDIANLCEAFLKVRRKKFFEFGTTWLDMNGYKGCTLETVTHSKSQPEMDGFHAVLKYGKGMRMVENAVERAIEEGGFAVDSDLDGLRQEMEKVAGKAPKGAAMPVPALA